MGKVIIVDADERHLNKLKLMLQKNPYGHEFSFFQESNTAMEKIAKDGADIFIASLELPVMAGDQIIQMVSLLHPNIICMMLTECVDIHHVISSMSECKIFRLILKPCECADDLIKPIQDAFQFLEKQSHNNEGLKDTQVSLDKLKLNLQEIQHTMSRNKSFYNNVYHSVNGMLSGNISFMDKELSQEYKQKLTEFMKHYYQTYLHYEIFAEEDFRKLCNEIKEEWSFEDKNQKFRILLGKDTVIPSTHSTYVGFIISLMGYYCHELLMNYDVVISVVRKDGYIIMKQTLDMSRCTNQDGVILYRTLKKDVIRGIKDIMKDVLEFYTYKYIMGDENHPFDIKALIKES